MEKELVNGISNYKLMRMARIGIAQAYDKTMAELEDAEKANDQEWVIRYYNDKLDMIEKDLNALDEAIALEAQEARA